MRHSRMTASGRRVRLRGVEALEGRALLASIGGTVFNDLDGNGSKGAGEGPLPGVLVFLDQNDNGALDLAASPSTFTATDVPKAILDNATAVSTLAVSGLKGVASLTVTLDLTHTYDADLTATLVSPSGKRVVLFDRIGGNGDGFTGTTFSDAAAHPIGSGSAPFLGTYRPLEPLSAFAGEDGNGTWTLEVKDSYSQDQGTLRGWSLSIRTYAESNRTTDANGTYHFGGLSAGSYVVAASRPSEYVPTFPTGDGKHRISLGASSSSTANFGLRLPPATIRGRVFNDLNGNGASGSGEGGLGGVTLFLDANGNGVADAGERSVVSGADGSYRFDNLTPNVTYTVRQQVPAGFRSTAPNTPSVATGSNVNLSKSAGSQTEGAVAINPANPQNIVVVSNTNTDALLRAVSFDGGATWSSRNIASGDGIPTPCCDGSVAFDSFGNLFLAYLDKSLKAVVAVSRDGGLTFRALTSSTTAADQPTVATGPGSVWVTYQRNGIQVSRGASVTALNQVGAFGPEQKANGSDVGIAGNFGDIAVGPNGQVAVIYQNAMSGEGPDVIYVNIDADGLGPGGYGPRIKATDTNVGGFDYITPQGTRSIDASSGLAWDRSNGPRRGRLYLVYTDEEGGNESNDTNVYVRYSDDNGATWSDRVRVNDDATSFAQFFPRIAVDSTTGNVAVTFHDARNSVDNHTVQYFGTISTDGGLSFLPNVALSAGTSTSPNDGFDFGDYTGMAYQGGRLWAAWGDNSNSTGDNGGVLDLYVNSAWMTTTAAHVVKPGPGEVASGRDFGDVREVTPRMVVDDRDFPFRVTGPGWNPAGVGKGGFGSDYRLHAANAPASSSNAARWFFQVGAGTYEVFATWVDRPGNAPDARYTILDGATTRGTVVVDQRAQPGDLLRDGVHWRSLGVYTISTLALQVVLDSRASGDLVADAVMLASAPSGGGASLRSAPGGGGGLKSAMLIASVPDGPAVVETGPGGKSSGMPVGPMLLTGKSASKAAVKNPTPVLVAPLPQILPSGPVDTLARLRDRILTLMRGLI